MERDESDSSVESDEEEELDEGTEDERPEVSAERDLHHRELPPVRTGNKRSMAANKAGQRDGDIHKIASLPSRIPSGGTSLTLIPPSIRFKRQDKASSIFRMRNPTYTLRIDGPTASSTTAGGRPDVDRASSAIASAPHAAGISDTSAASFQPQTDDYEGLDFTNGFCERTSDKTIAISNVLMLAQCSLCKLGCFSVEEFCQRELHLRPRIYSCKEETCHLEYVDRNDYFKHLEREHAYRYSCYNCKSKYDDEAVLKRHQTNPGSLSKPNPCHIPTNIRWFSRRLHPEEPQEVGGPLLIPSSHPITATMDFFHGHTSSSQSNVPTSISLEQALAHVCLKVHTEMAIVTAVHSGWLTTMLFPPPSDPTLQKSPRPDTFPLDFSVPTRSVDVRQPPTSQLHESRHPPNQLPPKKLPTKEASSKQPYEMQMSAKQISARKLPVGRSSASQAHENQPQATQLPATKPSAKKSLAYQVPLNQAPARKPPSNHISEKQFPASHPLPNQPPAGQGPTKRSSANQLPVNQLLSKVLPTMQTLAKQPSSSQLPVSQLSANLPPVKQSPTKQPSVRQPHLNQPSARRPPAKRPFTSQISENRPSSKQLTACELPKDQIPRRQLPTDQRPADKPLASPPHARQPPTSEPPPRRLPVIQPPPRRLPVIQPPPRRLPVIQPPPRQLPVIQPPPKRLPVIQPPPRQLPVGQPPPRQLPVSQPPRQPHANEPHTRQPHTISPISPISPCIITLPSTSTPELVQAPADALHYTAPYAHPPQANPLFTFPSGDLPPYEPLNRDLPPYATLYAALHPPGSISSVTVSTGGAAFPPASTHQLEDSSFRAHSLNRSRIPQVNRNHRCQVCHKYHATLQQLIDHMPSHNFCSWAKVDE